MADRYACGGKVPAFESDGLMVVDENLNSNKDDFWISRSYQLSLHTRPDGSARHTLRIRYGPYPSIEQLTTPYINWLRVYVPAGSRLVSAQGIDAQQASDLGNAVLQGWVQFDFGQSKEVSIVYDVPAKVMQARGRQELTWLKQAGRQADPIVVLGVRSNGQTTTINSDLEQDRVLSLR
jgi:hypothetical protein